MTQRKGIYRAGCVVTQIGARATPMETIKPSLGGIAIQIRVIVIHIGANATAIGRVSTAIAILATQIVIIATQIVAI